ncbi:NAD(P)/FAD-dependent oxidoreductase [Halospeciosus flavus]|uniref:NAD(P)/FAD-dependent oxidoreductase n=1 Tax=Halospeciosus flavus TaxID=3032283 RepID=A0ABD5Z238_9EURY|nr:NAD(P)/FAD-dependent oxidoreductase [Halospeciosus flavus]
MTDVIVVGGGPAGLSAGLFASKNDLDTVVFDTDETWLHKAHLYNYLGIRSMDGDVFIQRAREQATKDHGVDLREEEVSGVESHDDGFTVSTAEGEYDADYVVLATGANRDLAEEVGCTFDGDVVDVGVDMETSVENLYATGAMVRDQEWQAIISAGDGAAAALDILSKEKGEHYHDFDTPSDVIPIKPK